RRQGSVRRCGQAREGHPPSERPRQFRPGQVRRQFRQGPVRRQLRQGPVRRQFRQGPVRRQFRQRQVRRQFRQGPVAWPRLRPAGDVMARALALARLPALQVALGGLLLIVASLMGAFVPLDNALRDTRFGYAPAAATGNTVFVDIDAASLDSVGVWPWPRSVHARLLDRLLALGANRVAFDIDFAVASDAAGDAEFERALADAGGYAVLAAFRQRQIGAAAPAVNL